MMKHALHGVLCAGASFALFGCGADPLVGKWRPETPATPGPGGVQLGSIMEFRADGTAATVTTGAGSCAGTLTKTLQWRASGNVLTFGGAAETCEGAIVCTVSGTAVNLDCTTAGTSTPTTPLTYALSNGDSKLTLSSTVSGMSVATTYVRVN